MSAYPFHSEGFFGYGEPGANSLMIKLPLHVCQWGLYCAAFALMTRNDTLFGVSFFVTLCLTAPALFHLAYLIWKTAARKTETKTEEKTGG